MQPLYVDSAVRMPYDAPAQVGRPAVLDGYRKSFASRRLDPTLRLVPSSVNLSGARATEWGLYHETLVSRSNGPSLHEDGKYMMLAERDATGGWRYAWSMFNRDSAAVVTRLATLARIQAAACTTPEYRQFDFWVGDWDVFGPAGARTGTNRVDRLLNGCVLQEHWVGAGGSIRAELQHLRAFDAAVAPDVGGRSRRDAAPRWEVRRRHDDTRGPRHEPERRDHAAAYSLVDHRGRHESRPPAVGVVAGLRQDMARRVRWNLRPQSVSLGSPYVPTDTSADHAFCLTCWRKAWSAELGL